MSKVKILKQILSYIKNIDIMLFNYNIRKRTRNQ